MEETSNFNRFYVVYLAHLQNCVASDPDYSYVKECGSDLGQLAHKMVSGLITGGASKDGKAIRLTCKQLGIKQTYKAIQAYIGEK